MNPMYWYVDGVAYDFAEFVKKHPGGEYALYLGQGRECMPMIQSYHLDVNKVRMCVWVYVCVCVCV
jgi:cytochrome b involved in lipid metabolism